MADADSAPDLPRRAFLRHTTAGAAALGVGTASEVSAVPATDTPFMKQSAELRRELVACLGGEWPASCPLDPQPRETMQKEGYRIESLTYQVETGDRVPALLLVPDGVDEATPAAAIAVWHQHNGEYHLGKSEPAGLAGSPMHHTGVALAREGYVVLCPDALCFEERQDPTKRLRGGHYERFEFLRYVVEGRCMAWKNILDMRRAIDYLATLPEVDEGRLGCYGHSMGSTHTWLLGPHEPRLKALVGNCCLPTYAAIHDKKILHCFPNFVPGWQRFGDTPEMAALIAPRALHLNLGEDDAGSPIDHAREGVRRIAAAYRDAGVPDQFTHYIQDRTGHVLSPEMWAKTRAFFAKHLA